MSPATTGTDAGTDADVLVIGGGHNGLTAGCYLAGAGRRVVLLEASERIGGMTASSALIPEAPDHVIHPCAVDMIFIRSTDIVSDLRLSDVGLRTETPDPSYVYLHPEGGSIAFFRDPARTAADIARFSRADAEAYPKFVAVLRGMLAMALPMMGTDPVRPAPGALWAAVRAAVAHRRSLRPLLPLVTGTAEAAVNERFRHPAVRSALLALAGGGGPAATEGSGLGHLMVALLHFVGVARPLGGMQQLSEALASRFRASGGQIRTSARVREIVVVDGRARGVRLEDGSTVTARSVIATCDPYRAICELLPDGAIDRSARARIHDTPANVHGAAPAVLNVALAGPATLAARFERTDGVDLRGAALLMGTEESVRGSYEATARGEMPADPLLWGAITTAGDPSQAPAGQDTVYVYVATTPVSPPEGWPALRDSAEKTVHAKTARYFDGLEAELGRWFETPDEMSARLGVRNGSVFHVDLTLTRVGPLRPAWGFGGGRTPVGGLFLGSAGSHPGPGVFGAPGKLAAAMTAKFLRTN